MRECTGLFWRCAIFILFEKGVKQTKSPQETKSPKGDEDEGMGDTGSSPFVCLLICCQVHLLETYQKWTPPLQIPECPRLLVCVLVVVFGDITSWIPLARRATHPA